MRRTALPRIAAAALATASVPASAAMYTGTLYGTVTSGSAVDENDYTMAYSAFDLAGQAIKIDFIADVTYNYTDPDPYHPDFYPRYVISSVRITIAAPIDYALLGSSQTNDVNVFGGTTDYVGGASGGAFSISGAIADPDEYQGVSLVFSHASSTPGPITGSGEAHGSVVDQSGEHDSYDMYFMLGSGSLSATGVPAPEPAAWALLIAGMGVVGGMMRRRARVAAMVA